jgi:hypothetical protein
LHAYANADCDSNCYPNAHGHADCDSYGNSNCYSDGHTDCDAASYAYPDGNSAASNADIDPERHATASASSRA